MQHVKRLVTRMAKSRYPVLILGETGAGQGSRRASYP